MSDRYHDDPVYREEQIQRVKAKQKEARRQSALAHEYRRMVTKNLSLIVRKAQQYDIVLPGTERVVTVLGFSLPQLADLIGRRPQSLRLWIKDGLFPKPVVPLAVPTRQECVYTLKQAYAIAQAAKVHFDTKFTNISSLTAEGLIAFRGSVTSDW